MYQKIDTVGLHGTSRLVPSPAPVLDGVFRLVVAIAFASFLCCGSGVNASVKWKHVRSAVPSAGNLAMIGQVGNK